ncbi:MAG: hypothetical protein IKV72_02060 [Firmicutes bacterium]|nr:hypothetical protein [Bacillota bacterium]
MNKHLSVFKLLARSTILKILVILAVMVSAEVLIFTRQAEKMAGYAVGFFLEDIFGESFFFVCLFVAYFAVGSVLCRTGSRPGNMQTYTLQRLGISEYAIMAWQSLWNLICFLLLWAVQLWTVYLLLQNFLAKHPDAGFTQHHIFLAFWRHDVLHALLPMADVYGWIKNFLLASALSITTAYGSYVTRRTGKGSAIYNVMMVETALLFDDNGGFGLVITSVLVILILGIMFSMLRSKYELDSDESGKEEEPCVES